MFSIRRRIGPSAAAPTPCYCYCCCSCLLAAFLSGSAGSVCVLSLVLYLPPHIHLVLSESWNSFPPRLQTEPPCSPSPLFRPLRQTTDYLTTLHILDSCGRTIRRRAQVYRSASRRWPSPRSAIGAISQQHLRQRMRTCHNLMVDLTQVFGDCFLATTAGSTAMQGSRVRTQLAFVGYQGALVLGGDCSNDDSSSDYTNESQYIYYTNINESGGCAPCTWA